MKDILAVKIFLKDAFPTCFIHSSYAVLEILISYFSAHKLREIIRGGGMILQLAAPSFDSSLRSE
jgi:hypothetical protein